MSTDDNIIYKYINHMIHYFKKSPEGDFVMDELDALPQEIKEPIPKSIINNQSKKSNENFNNPSFKSNYKNSNNPDNETNNSTDNHNNYSNNYKIKYVNNNKNSSFDSFIIEKKYDLIIGIAMYAEDYNSIDSTLEGISQNLPALADAGISQDRILVLIISDGRQKVNKEVYETFTEKKLESIEEEIEKLMKNEVFSNGTYEAKKQNYLTSCMIKREKIKAFEKNRATKKSEMDILFSIKKENRGKLDSHHWLFAGFCKQINPQYIILLDTGTIPDLETGQSLSSLILPMKNDSDIAGTCGEMELSNETNCSNLTLCAQILEYKYAHVVDKNFESLFGYISVLPGAFSAYRWSALNDSKTLSEYFKTIGNDKADCAMANRYLAEDRIFCWVLFAMKNQANILRFIPEAKAKTDAPEIFGEFMLQRRRWINGSNFAMFYVLGKYSEIYETRHLVRQFSFLLLYIYFVIQAVLGYFTLGIYYFVYYMICEKNFSKNSASSSIIMSTYLFIIIFTIIASLSMKPIRVVSFNKSTKQDEVKFKQRTIYIMMSLILGLFNLFAFILGIYTIFNGGMNNPVKANFSTAKDYYQAYKEYWGALALAAVGIGNFIFPLLFHPSMICLWVKNFFQYLLFQPTYAIILNIFAVCNIDDVSWGNRDSNAHMSENNFKKYKLKYLAGWLIVNFFIGWGFSFMVSNPQSVIEGNDKKLINYYSILVASLSAAKLIGAMIGKFKYFIIDKRLRKIMENKDPKENGNQLINKAKGRIANRNPSEDFGDAYNTEKAALQQDKALEVKNFVDVIQENNNNSKGNNNDLELNDVEKGFVRENSNEIVNVVDIHINDKLDAVLDELKTFNHEENKEASYVNGNKNYPDMIKKIGVSKNNFETGIYESEKNHSSSQSYGVKIENQVVMCKK
jgi:cellulose synthase/poly-beta-1,6-N-acetylglucosamine synthase-like glycosyltransferase